MAMKKSLKSFYLNNIAPILSKFSHKPTPATREQVKDYAKQIVAQFNSLPDFPTNLSNPSENEWNENLNELKNLVVKNDLRDMLNWQVIQRTMFVVHAKYSKLELNFLKDNKDWPKKWKNAIHETQTGSPPPYIFYPQTSCNLLHHSYHLAKFEEWSSEPITATDIVVEFGGGYGGMCRLFYQLKYKGVYIIYDLKHFSYIQQFFLKCLGIPQLTFDEILKGKSYGFCTLDNENTADLINFLNKTKLNKTFLATWSLSEAPSHISHTFLENLESFDRFLIAFQDQFNEIDNANKFSQASLRLTHKTKFEKIEFLKQDSYFFGKK